MSLWCVVSEVLATDECQMEKGMGGAVVNSYLKANKPDDAIGCVRHALEEDHYEVYKIEECFEISLDENDDVDPEVYRAMYEANKTGEVTYGAFYCYPKSEIPRDSQ